MGVREVYERCCEGWSVWSSPRSRSELLLESSLSFVSIKKSLSSMSLPSNTNIISLAVPFPPSESRGLPDVALKWEKITYCVGTCLKAQGGEQ
ncbi:hypothetical protein E2C01_027295 [Portunus trituberculatus]|uniref:Uncharacterized protein n=1 Tax=Portunus trituberculatus TaxID=210409 RepID=A0A5B7EL60_PORTR|nr:hypothetical protein [Portunus trituberculatus]